MNNLSKISSRLLDYLWFWSILVFFIDIFDLSIFCYLIVTLLLPFLFIPIEAVLIKYFKTTLGKFIFGLKYDELFTWKSAFYLAYRRALLKRSPARIIRKKPKLFSHILAVTVATLLSLLSIFPDATLEQASKVLPFECIQTLRVNRNGGWDSPPGWIKIGSGDLPFAAFFPKEPKLEETSKPIPHSTHVLVYKEYTLDQYSLGYVALPASWVKWGSNLVFKGVLQQVASHTKGSITQKKKTLHEQFPAMNYEIRRGSELSFGRLVLVGNTIYRLEVTPTKTDEKPTATADMFFNTFHLLTQT